MKRERRMEHSISTAAEIRQNNKKKILSYLVDHDCVSKKDIERKTQLSTATISNLCNQLMRDGFLSIASFQKSSGGRNASLLTVLNNQKYYIALRVIDDTVVHAALVTFHKEIKVSFAIPVQGKDCEKIVEACARGVLQCLQQKEEMQVLGIGVALPGIVDLERGRLLNSTITCLEGENVIGKLHRLLPQYSITGENESNLIALAVARRYQENNRLQDTIYLHLDEGLGIGIICNGSLVTGSHNRGGEISHMPIGERDRICECGRRGCVEPELSIGGFLADYEEETGAAVSWEEFCRRAREHEKGAERVLEEKGKLLGKLVSVLDSLFDPYAFFIGGRGGDVFDEMYEYMIGVCEDRQTIDRTKGCSINPCYEYNELLVKGCADLVFRSFDITSD